LSLRERHEDNIKTANNPIHQSIFQKTKQTTPEKDDTGGRPFLCLDNSKNSPIDKAYFGSEEWVGFQNKKHQIPIFEVA
jgi:hypothetical protein